MKKTLAISIILLLVCSFSTIKVIAQTDLFVITNVEEKEKSETTEVNSLDFEKLSINSDVSFHSVGDYITYEITIKNNTDETYILKSIENTANNEYITFDCKNCTNVTMKAKSEIKTIFTAKYENQVQNMNLRNQKTAFNIQLAIVDEYGNPIYPDTSDGILFYVILAIASSFGLFLFHLIPEKKKIKKVAPTIAILIILFKLVPIVVYASDNTFDLQFDSKFELADRLIITIPENGQEKETIVNYGETIEIPSTHQDKEGYEFIGWYDEKGNELETSFKATSDTKLIQKYRAISYTITYHLNGGTAASNPETYTIESDAISLETPTKKGFVFDGWTGSNGETKQINVTIAKGNKGNREYTANWTAITYEVTYHGNGSTSGNMANSSHTYDAAKNLTINEYKKTGYVFKEWNTKENGSGTSYSDGQSVSNLTTTNNGTVTLYAQWEKIENVNIHSNGVDDYLNSIKSYLNANSNNKSTTKLEEVFSENNCLSDYATCESSQVVYEDSAYYCRLSATEKHKIICNGTIVEESGVYKCQYATNYYLDLYYYLKSQSTNYCDKNNNYTPGISGDLKLYEYNANTGTRSASALVTITNSDKIANYLMPGKTYYVESVEGASHKYLKVTSQVKMYNLDGVRNLRDLGGWQANNGTIKYGRLYRGNELTYLYNENLMTPASKLFNYLNLTEEIDLRSSTEIDNATNKCVNDYELSGCFQLQNRHHISTRGYVLSSTEGEDNDARDAVRKVMNLVNNGKNVYFHCVAGADRTGTLAYVIEGLLGVSQENRDEDYELTYFYRFDGNGPRHRYFSAYPNLAPTIGGYGTGSESDQIKFAKWFLEESTDKNADITMINTFRNNMIDGTPCTLSISGDTLVCN